MSGEQFVDLAVHALHARIASAFVDELRAVETELDLEVGALGFPRDVVAAGLPDDNRAPLVMVWDEGFDPIAQRADLYAVDCTVAMTQLGGADLERNAIRLRRWVTAMVRTIRKDPTLGGAVVGAILQPGAAAGELGDKSATRLVYLLPIEVRVHST